MVQLLVTYILWMSLTHYLQLQVPQKVCTAMDGVPSQGICRCIGLHSRERAFGSIDASSSGRVAQEEMGTLWTDSIRTTDGNLHPLTND